MSFDWKSIVSTVAPVLGMAIGGPFGGIASKVIQDALGVDSEEAMVDAIQHDPEALIKLKTANNDFRVRMKELGIKEEQLHQQDRSNARDLAKSNGIYFQAFLTVVFIVGYFGLFYLFFGGAVSELNDWQRGQVGVLIGVLTGAIPQLLSFWFGSSKGSSDKTRLMAGNK